MGMEERYFPGLSLGLVCQIGQRYSMKIQHAQKVERRHHSGPRGGNCYSYDVKVNDGNLLCMDWSDVEDLYAVAKAKQQELWLAFFDSVLMAKAQNGNPRATLPLKTLEEYFPGLTATEICEIAEEQSKTKMCDG